MNRRPMPTDLNAASEVVYDPGPHDMWVTSAAIAKLEEAARTLRLESASGQLHRMWFVLDRAAPSDWVYVTTKPPTRGLVIDPQTLLA